MPGKTEITDQEYVENIVKAIVDHPEEVITGRTLDERGVLIQLTVNREDMGKVIGREGRTAKAIRSLLRVFGARNESRINLKIVDPEGETAAVPEESAPATVPEDSKVLETPPETGEKKVKEIKQTVAAKPADLSAKTASGAEVATPTESAPAEEKATGVI